MIDRLRLAVERAYPGTQETTSREMRAAMEDWASLYYGYGLPKEESGLMRLPVLIVSKLNKAIFGEYEAQAEAGQAFAEECKKAIDAASGRAMQHAEISGASWLKPYVYGGRVGVTVVRGDQVCVLGRGFDGSVSDIAMAEITEEQASGVKKTFTLLERRRLERDGTLTIQNRLFMAEGAENIDVGREIPLGTLDRYAELQPEYSYPAAIGGIGMAEIRMPGVNCVDGSNEPVSVYAPAAELIHGINRNEKQMEGEFENGRSRIMVSNDLLTVRRDSCGRQTKRLTDTVFTALDESPEEVPITIFAPELRYSSFEERRNGYLYAIESLIGVKHGLISDTAEVQRTATEVNSSAGDYSLTVIELQKAWEAAAREALRLCGVLGVLHGVAGAKEIAPAAEVSISWGNGVLYDKGTEEDKWYRDVSAGLLKPELYLAWRYDEPATTPEELKAVREKYMPDTEQMLEE